jgi:hypothetical protein
MSLAEFFTSGRVRSAQFPTLGASVGGPITEEPKDRQQTDFHTHEPLFWPDGEKKMQVVVTVATDLRDEQDDDGRRRIFIKGQMRDAVAKALKDAGAREPAVGGVLTVTYVDDGKPTDKGLAPPKNYDATYIPPDDYAADDEALGTAELGDFDEDAPPF